MVDAAPQEIITNDNLNARADAVVYFKVLAEEENVKSSQYRFNFSFISADDGLALFQKVKN